MITTASPSLPRASATGIASWLSCSTSIPAGASVTVAHAMIASDSSPPSGKPTNTLRRAAAMSRADQPSSTPPEEKKNTS